ncbi:MAG: hypothetical protein L0H46_05455 [Brevibacterium sp.]|nr:hypothetical protein [Brevibacterium sp.]MDN6187854.1 hypothetical protein [Brevibacterium sp.]
MRLNAHHVQGGAPITTACTTAVSTPIGSIPMSSETTEAQELIRQLKNPTTRQKPRIRTGVDKVVFFTAGVLAVEFGV